MFLPAVIAFLWIFGRVLRMAVIARILCSLRGRASRVSARRNRSRSCPVSCPIFSAHRMKFFAREFRSGAVSRI